MIKSDVRSKLRALFFNISFLDRMLDAVFVERISIKPLINNESFLIEAEQEERKEVLPGGPSQISYDNA